MPSAARFCSEPGSIGRWPGAYGGSGGGLGGGSSCRKGRSAGTRSPPAYTTTIWPRTAGVLSTSPPVATWLRTSPSVAPKAYSVSSREPTSTVSPCTTGDERTSPPVSSASHGRGKRRA